MLCKLWYILKSFVLFLFLYVFQHCALEEFTGYSLSYILKKIPLIQAEIDAALVPVPKSEVLVNRFNLKITRRDVQTLMGLNWLNDQVRHQICLSMYLMLCPFISLLALSHNSLNCLPLFHPSPHIFPVDMTVIH